MFTCRDATGKFPDFPDIDEGGSEVIFKKKEPEVGGLSFTLCICLCVCDHLCQNHPYGIKTKVHFSSIFRS